MKLWDAIKKPFGKKNESAIEKAPFDGGFAEGGESILTRILTTGSAPKRGSRELLEAYKNLPWLRPKRQVIFGPNLCNLTYHFGARLWPSFKKSI